VPRALPPQPPGLRLRRRRILARVGGAAGEDGEGLEHFWKTRASDGSCFTWALIASFIRRACFHASASNRRFPWRTLARS
jgi:hypothetical protein